MTNIEDRQWRFNIWLTGLWRRKSKQGITTNTKNSNLRKLSWINGYNKLSGFTVFHLIKGEISIHYIPPDEHTTTTIVKYPSLILLFSVFFFLIYLLFILFLWLCWVFVSVRGLPLVVASGGHSSSRCTGLSLSRPLSLRSTGSRRTGSVIVAHGPSCSAACGIFPDQGSNPCPLHWQADSQPLRHQGSQCFLFIIH